MIDKNKLNRALKEALFYCYKQIDNGCYADYEPLDDEDFNEITEEILSLLDERPVINIPLETITVEPQAFELDVDVNPINYDVSVSISLCNSCGAKVKGEGDSLHCWHVEYECGAMIVGAISSDGHIQHRECPNKL